MFWPEDEAYSSPYAHHGTHEEVFKVNKETEAFTAIAFPFMVNLLFW